MIKLSNKYIFFGLFVLFASLSFPQQWLTRQYTVQDGLPSPSVYGIAQDHEGMMWMATRSGIACYDGTAWQTFKPSDGLPALAFDKITVDPAGHIWALSRFDQGDLNIVYYKDNRWKSLPPPAKTGNVWGGFTGLHAIAGKNENNPVIIVSTVGAGIFLWESSEWRNITTGNGLLSNNVNGIIVLGKKIIAATDNGLSIIKEDFTVDNSLDKHLGLPSPVINGICIETNGIYPDLPPAHSRIWLYGHHWLASFDVDGENIQSHDLYDSLDTEFIEEKREVILQPDYRGGLYMGNHYNLFYFNYKTRRAEIVSLNNGLVGRGANSIFIDFERNIWIACNRGVTKIVGRQFTSFQAKDGLLEDEVSAILEYEPGKFLLGHNKGFTFYDVNNGSFEQLPVIDNYRGELSLCRVLEMRPDTDGYIWCAMGRSGILRLGPVKKSVQWLGKYHELPNNIVSLWVEPGKPGGSKDKLWVASEDGLFMRMIDNAIPVNRVDHGTPFISVPIAGLSNPPLRRMFGDDEGLRYLAGQGTGVFILDKKTGQWKNYQLPGKSKINEVYAILKDKKNRLLVGTVVGLYILEEGEFKRFNENGFKVDRPVYFLVEDNVSNRNLWIGTDNGIIRWDGDRAIDYSVLQGLTGMETNRAAGIVDSTGKLWIGTDRGFSIYEKSFDPQIGIIPPPKLRLLDLVVDNRRIPLSPQNRPVELDYKTGTIMFHFRGISFLDEKSIRFKHKLDGFDNDWLIDHYPYNQVIRYTNLPPGTYRFRIKARNSVGVWSETAVSPGISIAYPFYKQWWFFLILFMAAGLLLYSIFHYYSARQSAHLLEKLVEERTSQLQASEKRYRALIEESRDMIFTSSVTGEFLDVNPAGVALMGFKSKEDILNGKITSDSFYPEDVRAALFGEIREKGYLKDFEFQVTRKDGDKRTVLVTATPILGGTGEILGLRGIVRDITDNKRLHQQLEQAQKMEAIGTLAGGIAHDFNNILSVITGYIELSLDDLPEGTLVRNNIDQVLIAAGRAKELVNQILTFSRRNPKERNPLRISVILKEVLKLLRSSLPTTMDIRQEIQSDSGMVMADTTQIQQVVMNLCTNAAHAMREKGGVLTVGLHEVYLDETSAAAYDNIVPGSYLRLTVGDTGHGIEPGIIKRIFEPYFTTKKKGEGTGMGLAVIHGIVKSHGGDITVYSEPGEGTVFHVLLPTIEETADAQSIETEIIPTGKSEHILFVDDEKLLVEVGQKILEKLGYRVTAKKDSVEALEIFRRNPDDFQLVVTDFTMPRLTGLQLTTELRKLRPDIPVILCTGYSEAVTRQQIEALGIQEFLLKPVTKNSLAKAIRKILETE